jgi:type VI secretion system protein VasD
MGLGWMWLKFLPLVLSLSLLGCSGAQKPSAPKPTVVKIALDVDPAVNPDARGRPSPIVVRMFELKSLAAFNASDFFSLFDRERETLGADLVAREELQLQPQEQRSFDRVLQSETRYVGVVAAFRDLEQARWRSAIPVKGGETVPLLVRLDSRAINLSVP